MSKVKMLNLQEYFRDLLKKLVVALSLIGLTLTGCESYQVRTLRNCVPEVSFSSTDAYEFAIIKPGTAQGEANLKNYSELPVDKGEYHLYISSSNVINIESTVKNYGLELVRLPTGTELRLEGTVKRTIPLGLQRTFSSSLVHLKGKVGGDTVWVTAAGLASMTRSNPSIDVLQKLVALGLVDPKTYLSVGSRAWQCPK